MNCAVSEWATGIVAVLASTVLIIRELRRAQSGGIPPLVPPEGPVKLPEAPEE